MKSIVEKFFSGRGLNLGESIVNELVDIDDPSNKAKISNGGITTVGHVDDKGIGISNSVANLEKELVSAGFEMKKNLVGDKTFTNHKTGDMVKLSGTKAEIKTSTSKYNVDLSKFNTKQIMSVLTNKFPENASKIKEASPLVGPKLRKYAFGVTEVTIDPSKRTMTVSHNGNMGASDAEIVSNVQSLIQKLKSGSNADGSYIESIFRKMNPVKVDGSPDYSYTEVYKLPKSI
jgi:hypothetical protein